MSVGYLSAFAVFSVGVMDWHDRRHSSLPLRRLGYVALLVVSAIPSFVLLLLTPLIFIAGAGLVRQPSEVARSA